MASVSSLDDTKRKKKLSRLSDSEEESNDEEDKLKKTSRPKSKHVSSKKPSKTVKYSSDEDDNDDQEDDSSNARSESDDEDEDEDNNDEDDFDDDDDDDESEAEKESNDDSNYSSDSNNDKSDDSDYQDFFRRSSRLKSKKKSSSSNGKGSKSKTRSSKTPKTLKSKDKVSSSSKSKKSNESRRTTTSKKINYCEESGDDHTDTDDMIYKYEQVDQPVEASSSKADPGSGDANVETIEKVLRHRIGRVGAIGSKTAIYNVEEYGDPNEKFKPDAEQDMQESQYLIKWEGWSHLHNTWESKESLLVQKVKGFKKLENYLRKEEEIRQSKIEMALTPEDLEYMECQAEMMDNLLETHCNVERIIADNGVKNATGTSTDFLCKWQGLPYSECTWEDGELLRKRFPKLIEEFEKRQNVQTLPPVNVKSQKALRVRPRFVALKEQPAYLGKSDPHLKLRDYQLDGLNWLANSWCKQNGIILADEMGLGKTVQAISFVSYVFNEHNLFGPFLIVIPLSTMQGWQREFQKWCPEVNFVIYLGDGNSRSMIQKYEWFLDNKKIKCNAILTTYEILLKDKAFFNSVSWAALIVDEAHRLKNEDSLLYRTLIKFDTNHRLLITGTPLQNSLKELWALLHFIMPERFENWEDFDLKYNSVLSDGLRFQDLHKELQPYLLRRVKKDVEKSLPAKVEQILRVEMTKSQKQYYKLILTKNYKELAKGSKGNVNSFLNIMMELKKCSNHNYLIRRDDGPGENLDKLIKGSGKLFLLDKLLRRLKETGHRVLIFSQMVRMLDIIAEYLKFRRFPFQRLDGSIKGEIRRQALDHFNKEDSEDFCFLLSTRAGGLGINLSTADTVIIYDSDWNPQNDLQAQARAHRIGQKNQVNIYRLVSQNSIEEDIVERAKQKMVLDHLVIQRMDTTGRTVLNKANIGASVSNPFSKEEINSILKFGAEELFKEKETVHEDEKEELQMYDIDEILKRAETREETGHLSASEELLSQFKVANFSTMEDDPIVPNTNNNQTSANVSYSKRADLNDKAWDEIIPESDRERIELEEENEKLKLMNLTLEKRRNRSNRQSKKSSDEDDQQEDYMNEPDSVNSSDSEHRGSKSTSSKKRSKNSLEHLIKGFNAQEVRRFVRSYRKFPCPLNRIDTIAQDAHLEEKSQASLIEFAKKMQYLCKTAITEQHDSKSDEAKKKRERGPVIILNGVKLYAQQILDAEKYFEPLAHYSSSINDAEKFQFKTKLKQTYWDCEWSVEDDKALLRGIYEYGYGNWEWIKADTQLKLAEKILVNLDQIDTKSKAKGKESDKRHEKLIKLKPQSKHLRTRIDYLIKVLQNQINVELYGPDWKASVKTDENGNSVNRSNRARKSVNNNRKANSNRSKRKLKQQSNGHHNHDSNDSDESETNSESKKKRNNSGEESHSHHHNNHQNSVDHDDLTSDQDTHAHNSTRSKQGQSDAKKPNPKDKKIILSEKTFNECKNILRPVKKALKNIDVGKETNLSEKDQLEKIKKHILEIGDTINDHLTMYSDPEKIKEWRNYLWVFVSKFTSSWNWEKINNLYKKFANTRDEELYKPIDYKNFNNSNNHNTSGYSTHGSSNHYANSSGQKYYKKDSFSKSNQPYDSWKSEKYDNEQSKERNYTKKKDYSSSRRDRESEHKTNSNYLQNNFYPHQQPKPYFAAHSYDYQPGLLGSPSNDHQKPYRPGIFDSNPNFQSHFHPSPGLTPFMNNSPFNAFPVSNSAYSYLNRKSSFNKSPHDNPKKVRIQSTEHLSRSPLNEFNAKKFKERDDSQINSNLSASFLPREGFQYHQQHHSHHHHHHQYPPHHHTDHPKTSKSHDHSTATTAMTDNDFSPNTANTATNYFKPNCSKNL